MAATPKTTPSFEPAQAAPVEIEILEIVRELLRELGSHRAAEAATLHSSFDRDLGLGSLERVELLVRCESRFNVRLPDEIAQRAETPAEWARALLEPGRLEMGPSRSARSRYHVEQPTRQAPPEPRTARTWVEVLRRQAEVEPSRVHIHLLEEGGGQDITYGELLETASRVATGLTAAGLQRNETVAIMLPTCADFFYAFFGVMMAGGIAVPIYPPARPDKIEEYVRRQVSILRNAEVRFLISFDRVKAVAQLMRLSLPSLVDVKTVDTLRQAGAELVGVHSPHSAVEPSDVGFIQYTSGSTGDPKGVVLTQSNILENVRGIGWAVKLHPTDIVVSWLPLYHDMGLIGSWLFSVYYGAPITLLSPLDFLTRPERWLWALHDSRGTLCPAPNFAYELCARKIPDRALEGLDLSAWRVAIDAGEAVLPDTLTRFAKRFAPYGFRPEAFMPCYGLAESSVALAFPPVGRTPVIDTIRRDAFETEGRAVPVAAESADDAAAPSVLRFVANGRALPNHGIRIVDDEGRELGERIQGRLFFRGLSRTPGYHRNPAATAAALTPDGWMDSGDLGYWGDGELYITGRTKDCIIKSGRNIVPQEVEAAAAEVPGVRKGCVAAFGTADPDTGTERLIVVAETRATAPQELQRIEAEIAKSVDTILGIPPNKVALVPPQSIPKTSSGKIRRNETRALFERGELRAVRKPPWLQMLRLGFEHFDLWVGSGLGRMSATIRRAYTSVLFSTIARLTGFWVRLVPSHRAAAKSVHWAARCLLGLSGESVVMHGGERVASQEPAVLVANRAGRLDPLVLAASLPAPFFIADAAMLANLPRQAAFLLKPLLLAPLRDEVAPPGGTLRQRIRRSLEQGHAVLVLPDGPPGVSAHRSRFRLDALHAAVVTSSPIVPIGIQGTFRILQPVRNLDGNLEDRRARVSIGDRILPEVTDARELVALRERLRDAIGKLCQ